MGINPIRDEIDCEKALRRVEELWGAPADTANGEELDALLTLVEAHERNC